MPKLDYRNVEIDVCPLRRPTGRSGNSNRVAAILTCYRQGMGVEEIVQQYAGLRPADVHELWPMPMTTLDEIEAASGRR